MATKVFQLAALSLAIFSGSVLAANQPDRGMSMQEVKAKFGAPDRILPAVGNPPITRWVYRDYTVYFERNLALDTVFNAAAPATQATAAPAIVSGTQATTDKPVGQAAPTQPQQTAAPKAAVTPAPVFNPATGSFSVPEQQPASNENEGSATAVAVPAAAAPALQSQSTTTPTTATPAAAAPATSSGGGFHFDPVTGRIVMDGAPAATANDNSAPIAEEKSAPMETAAPSATTTPTATTDTTESNQPSSTTEPTQASDVTEASPQDSGNSSPTAETAAKPAATTKQPEPAKVTKPAPATPVKATPAAAVATPAAASKANAQPSGGAIFNPATGQFEPVSVPATPAKTIQPATPAATSEATATAPVTTPATSSAPAPAPAEKPAPASATSSGGFSIDWNKNNR